MLSTIELSNKLKKPLFISYIDIVKAYDSIEFQGLFKILLAYKSPEQLITLLADMYKDNTSSIRFPYGNSPNFHINKGVKQGCPLSPLSFTLFINPLLD